MQKIFTHIKNIRVILKTLENATWQPYILEALLYAAQNTIYMSFLYISYNLILSYI